MSCIIDKCMDTLEGSAGNLFLLLIQSLVNTQCSLDPLNQYQENYATHLRKNEEFDYIIIGAGSAGSVIANRLTEDGNTTVLLVEAGGIPSVTSEMPLLWMDLQQTNEDWQYVNQPNNKSCLGMVNRKCRVPRGKVLGGSSGINAMIYTRGSSYYYDAWGLAGWSYEELLPYFFKSENCLKDCFVDTANTTHGMGGYLTTSYYDSDEPLQDAILLGAQELGYPVTDDEPMCTGFYQSLVTTVNGMRCSSSVAFLSSVEDTRQNLKIAYNTLAEKVLFENTQAVGVKLRYEGVHDRHKSITVRARNEVILSAGVVNTPQLLMLSGIGPKEELDIFEIETIADLKVGNNLQDHIGVFGFVVKVKDTCVLPVAIKDALYDYFMYREGRLSTLGLFNVLGFINNNNATTLPNVLFHHLLVPRNDTLQLASLLRNINFTRAIQRSITVANAESPLLFFIPVLLAPHSRGNVKLQSKNPRVKMLINGNYLSDPYDEDVDALLAGVRFAERMLTTEGFACCNPEIVRVDLPECDNDSEGFGTDSYWKCLIRYTASSMYDPVGTCKMGQGTEEDVVVNERLLVSRVCGLRIADASILPNITGGGINAVAIMIGEKASDMIKEDNGGLQRGGEGTEIAQCEGIEEVDENEEKWQEQKRSKKKRKKVL